MKKQTYYLAFRPGGGTAHLFPTYQEAWEFTERQFTEGKGVWCVERVN